MDVSTRKSPATNRMKRARSNQPRRTRPVERGAMIVARHVRGRLPGVNLPLRFLRRRVIPWFYPMIQIFNPMEKGRPGNACHVHSWKADRFKVVSRTQVLQILRVGFGPDKGSFNARRCRELGRGNTSNRVMTRPGDPPQIGGR